MNRRSLTLSLLAFALTTGSGVALSGCGGGSSDNSTRTIEIEIDSSDIEDLQVFVSPRQGAINASDACTESTGNSGFGCTTFFETDRTTLRFEAQRFSESQPYYVYVRNNSGGTRGGTMTVFVEGNSRYTRTFTIDRDTDRTFASVFFDRVTDF